VPQRYASVLPYSPTLTHFWTLAECYLKSVSLQSRTGDFQMFRVLYLFFVCSLFSLSAAKIIFAQEAPAVPQPSATAAEVLRNQSLKELGSVYAK
jgi:hypothetical protein